jgi:Raf kinase inhibitor-like YbhB/YbcL family protein
MSFSLKSTEITEGGEIAKKYSCDGADLSPALNWYEVPAKSKSLALIADDPDAPVGTWTHWVMWNIPVHEGGLAEGVPKVEFFANGARQGKNDFKRIGYGGPCPPAGKAHRYFFKLYALDVEFNLKAGAGKRELEAAMKNHVVAVATLMGIYKR